MEGITQQGIEQEINHIVEVYGKIGLLIDDVPDADVRLAREFYGSEVLPRWWCVVRSAHCGQVSLDLFLKIMTSDRAVLGILVADRYLPSRCDDQHSRPQAIDWKDPEMYDGDGDVFVGLIKLLECDVVKKATRWSEVTLGKDDAPPFLALFLTSFSHGSRSRSDAERVANLSWRTRNLGEVARLRREIGKGRFRALGNFGPARSNETVTLLVKRQQEFWDECLPRLAEDLWTTRNAEDRSAVLMTGAGCSLRQGLYGCGTPSTLQILLEAREIVRIQRGEEASLDPEDRKTQCACRGKERTGWWKREEADRRRGKLTSLEDLLNLPLDDVREREPKLESIFGEMGRPAEELERAFRHLLHQYDYRFPYHDWLLAQMGWHAVITTNFDRFHERACASVLAELRARREVRLQSLLSLGSVVSEDWYASVAEEPMPEGDTEMTEKVLLRHRMFKPYGSLDSVRRLCLSDRQLLAVNKEKRFALALREALRSESVKWLVVIGHSLRDDFIRDAIDKARESIDRETFNVVWVDPNAVWRTEYGSKHEDGRREDRWEALLGEKLEKRRGWPLSCTALEFVYDLWKEILRQRSAS